MKRLLSGFCTAAVLSAALCTLPLQALAQPTEGWISTTVEGGVANLRSQPTSIADVRATAKNGSRFSIIGSAVDSVGYVWYQIRPSVVTPTDSVWVRSDLVSFVAPIAAQPKKSCDSAIAQVEDQLRAVPNVQIVERSQNRHGYRINVPPGRQDIASFRLGGSGAANVMASTVLMNGMAAQMIENCPTTGIVSFSIPSYADGYVHFGYMPENTVRPFQCRRGPTSNEGLPSWGERNCL